MHMVWPMGDTGVLGNKSLELQCSSRRGRDRMDQKTEAEVFNEKKVENDAPSHIGREGRRPDM